MKTSSPSSLEVVISPVVRGLIILLMACPASAAQLGRPGDIFQPGGESEPHLGLAVDSVDNVSVAGARDESASQIGVDCNSNGVPDATDIADGTSLDCNTNGIPDECDTAAVFSAQLVITTVANGVSSVFSADLDGDGDADVLSASWLDDKIVWYENTDGIGTFGAQQVITTAADRAVDVFSADLDGDGDNDVLSASRTDNKVAWYENTDGLGHLGAQQVITNAAAGAYSVFSADLDGDGDADVLSASKDDKTIAWYENTDGLGTFGPQKIISTAANGAHSVFSADLDGDGDADVLSASRFDNKIAWYENTDGLGSFGAEQIITTTAEVAVSVCAADLDGDGDADVLSASDNDDKIAWYENMDGLGNFGAPQVITTDADGAWSVFSTDLDGDGDIDVLSASRNDNKVAWYENIDGLGNFGPQKLITTAANNTFSVFSADLDGDGDADVLSTSFADDKIAWHENTRDDCNGNSVPDECEVASHDCNSNDVPDECDIAAGARDRDSNGIPDSCELVTDVVGTSLVVPQSDADGDSTESQ